MFINDRCDQPHSCSRWLQEYFVYRLYHLVSLFGWSESKYIDHRAAWDLSALSFNDLPAIILWFRLRDRWNRRKLWEMKDRNQSHNFHSNYPTGLVTTPICFPHCVLEGKHSYILRAERSRVALFAFPLGRYPELWLATRR